MCARPTDSGSGHGVLLLLITQARHPARRTVAGANDAIRELSVCTANCMLSIGLSLAGLGISLCILICRRFLKDRRLRRSAEWARLAQHAERLATTAIGSPSIATCRASRVLPAPRKNKPPFCPVGKVAFGRSGVNDGAA